MSDNIHEPQKPSNNENQMKEGSHKKYILISETVKTAEDKDVRSHSILILFFRERIYQTISLFHRHLVKQFFKKKDGGSRTADGKSPA